MRQRIYLCEGETEQHLIKALKDRKLIEPGQAQVFNAVQRNAEPMLRKWKQKLEIVLVVDADTGPYEANSRLAKNLKMLEDRGCEPRLILQCGNLEEELTHCCRSRGLYDAFNASSDSEFKSNFLKVRKDQLISKLKHCGFDFSRLWQMDCKGDKLDSTLMKYLWDVSTNVSTP